MSFPLQNTNQSQHIAQSIFILREIGAEQSQIIARVDFSPTFPSQLPLASCPQEQLKQKKTYPVFNNDRSYYTPAFVNEQFQETMGEQKRSKLLALHHFKAEVLSQKEQIYLPKPQKINRKCSICKVAFEDYLTHIALPQHTQLLRQSLFYQHISQLSSCFAIKTKKISKEKKMRQLQRMQYKVKKNGKHKTSSNQIIASQDEFQLTQKSNYD